MQEDERSFYGHSSGLQYGHPIRNKELKKKICKLTRRDEGLLHGCVLAGEKKRRSFAYARFSC